MNIKKDYTYIATLDSESEKFIRNIQKEMIDEIGYTDYVEKWPPHSTLSFGNLLTDDELVEVENKLQEVSKKFKPIKLKFKDLSYQKKERKGVPYYAVRFVFEENSELRQLSEQIQAVAKDYEVPFGTTESEFRVSLGSYADINEENVKKFIDNCKKSEFPEVVIDNVSIYYSIFNQPPPERALEIKRINL